jgi:hypothetical protein
LSRSSSPLRQSSQGGLHATRDCTLHLITLASSLCERRDMRLISTVINAHHHFSPFLQHPVRLLQARRT